MSSSSKHDIHIGYSINDDILVSSFDLDRYDIERSLKLYEELCESTLADAYAADIEIIHYNSAGVSPAPMRTVVYLSIEGDAEQLAENVDIICEKIASQSELWLVEAPSVPAHRATEYHPSLPAPVIRRACDRKLIGGARKDNGLWRVPVKTLKIFAATVKHKHNSIIHSCSGIDWIIWENIGETTVAQLHDFAEILIISRTGFGLEMLSPISCYLRLISEQTSVTLIVEHFVDIMPWSYLPWTYEAYCEQIEKGITEQKLTFARELGERDGLTRTDSISLRFEDHLSENTLVRSFVQSKLDRIKELVTIAEATLRGIPAWSTVYEQDELLFHRKVLGPLLYKLGFHSVRYTHGPMEHGRDFVMAHVMPFQETIYIGLQAKRGSITGGTRSPIEELIDQIGRAFKQEYPRDEFEPGRPESRVYISCMIVAASGDITDNARAQIRAEIGSKYGIRGNVFFWDRTTILSLFSSYFPAKE